MQRYRRKTIYVNVLDPHPECIAKSALAGLGLYGAAGGAAAAARFFGNLSAGMGLGNALLDALGLSSPVGWSAMGVSVFVGASIGSQSGC